MGFLSVNTEGQSPTCPTAKNQKKNSSGQLGSKIAMYVMDLIFYVSVKCLIVINQAVQLISDLSLESVC